MSETSALYVPNDHDTGEQDAAVLSGTVMRFRSLVDGSVRVEIDLHGGLAELAALGMEHGTHVAVARLSDLATATTKYGQYAKALRLSGFFYQPEVWPAIGKDEHYRAWLAQQRCHMARGCAGDVVAAHVRRVGRGSGTGIKPGYSAVPLCDKHHQLQHQKGESALMAKVNWDAAADKYLLEWGWETLRTHLGVGSMRDASPAAVVEWARSRDVAQFLPAIYRMAA
ncbi:MAG TPA: hypothetical protein VFP95_07195 [Gammaproteobacteria bacterium]|nr:hypothetical protein [Gammaproteobacteria bacterium]